MKLYIEAIILLLLLGVVAIWLVWSRISLSRALKKYKPENDKGRKTSEDATRGGETNIGAGKPAIEAAVVPVPASPDTSNNAGEDGTGTGGNTGSNRKDRNIVRSILNKFRRKK